MAVTVKATTVIWGVIWCSLPEIYQHLRQPTGAANISNRILYFVDRASHYKFLVITNLTHFFIYLFTSCP